MSLELSRSGNIECKSYPEDTFNGEVRIGDKYIHPQDFVELVMYFMTNNDVDDSRLDLYERMLDLKHVDGYAKGNWRFSEK